MEDEVKKFKLAQSKIRSHLPEFGQDLYSFCKFIKEKYGVWVTAYFSENGDIITALNFDYRDIDAICL